MALGARTCWASAVVSSASPSRLSAARQVAREAADLVRMYAADLSRLSIREKGVQDFVTQADREVEALIRKRLAEAFPDDGFLGEETGRTDGSGPGHWVVDPIDGTANFMRGVPWYGVSVAFVRNESVELGVIEDVPRARTFWAERGSGAYLDDQRIFASTQTALHRSALCVGFWSKGPSQPFLDTVERAVHAKCDVRRFGAATLGLAFVACGAVEGFWQSAINSWDVAAGIVLVREAGGYVSPFFDRGGLDGPVPLLACARPLAEALWPVVDFPQALRA
ncbi:MAG: inositol monophosphatase family protein [Myxococcota bacterium]